MSSPSKSQSTYWNPLRATAQTEVATRSAAALGWGAYHLINESTPEREHAQSLATAEAARREADSRTLWGVAEGDPALRPGAWVDVPNVVGETPRVWAACHARVTAEDIFATAPPSAPGPDAVPQAVA